MFELKKLPYESSAFGDFLSPTCFEYHHGKHLATYVNNLNNFIKGTKYENMSLVEIIKDSEGAIFNNAAQIFNHEFYFDCLSATKQEPCPDFKKALEKDLPNFKEDFIASATSLFGSGWTWLVYDKSFKIVNTQNANTPILSGGVVLLVVDVWEHAYYIDHKNARAVYLQKFFEHINWDFVCEQFKACK